jgi:hypothetical protein
MKRRKELKREAVWRRVESSLSFQAMVDSETFLRNLLVVHSGVLLSRIFPTRNWLYHYDW